MAVSSHDFDEFMKEPKEASDAFVNGEFEPLNEVSTQASPATLFGPNGDCVKVRIR